ncbi:MAG: class I SAM-dependent methyltransferase [Candidatus Sumerlaeota bacterium]|nr:class I SAM-dependent methyltransferase [Candidatus Sumerlaeota bacterium]
MFRCPDCHAVLAGFPPAVRCSSCGSSIPREGRILVFTNKPGAQTQGEATYVGYDEVAAGYDECLHPEGLKRQLFSNYAKAISEEIGESRAILDLGCGPGSYALELARRGHRVIAADISLNMLRILDGRMPADVAERLVPCRMDAHSLPLCDQSLGAVLALNFFHFVGNPEAVAREARRVLRPGGWLIALGAIREECVSGAGDAPMPNLIRRYYGEELRKGGIVEARPPGWTSRQIPEHLSKWFGHRRTIESDALRLSYSVSAGWHLEKLRRRYTMFQIGIDERAHTPAIERTHERLNQEFGPAWPEKVLVFEAAHSLDLYFDSPA